MRLKRLILQGFKSFKDRQVISFDDGITGIVGPNGCGKSNIVDALFWAMGGQSAKHLRGHSMKDLIFAGSSQYAPCPFAEVTLVLDNKEGRQVHVGRQVTGPSEIQLARKLYRDGESEYRINGVPCRLRDIQEIFMDTGSGAKSYSVIAQGEIDRLVQSRPPDRRHIIEEVAGITKFKMRRRESVRKIEVARQNLDRLHDLQGEIEKHLQTLKRQSERAREARGLKERVRQLDLALNSHKVFDQLQAMREKGQALHQRKIDRETWWTRCKQLEISLERERHQSGQCEAELEAMQKEYNHTASALMVAEEKLKHLTSRKGERAAELELHRNEAQVADGELRERKERREHLLEQKRKWNRENEYEMDISQAGSNLEQLKQKLASKEELLSRCADDLGHTRKTLEKVEQVIFQNQWQAREVLRNQGDNQKDIASTGEHSAESLQLLEERLKVKEQSIVELRSRIKANEQNLQQWQVLLEEKTKAFVQTESKLHSLKAIRASLGGVKAGTSAFLKEHQGETFALLDHLIQTEECYAKGVQLLLRQFMGSLVSRTGSESELADWPQSYAQRGGDLWMPDSDWTKEQKTPIADLIPLNQVVQVSSAYAVCLEPLFEGHYLAPELHWREEFLKCQLPWKAIANFDGSYVIRNCQSGVKFEYCVLSEETLGAVECNNQISKLSQMLGPLSQEVTGLEEKISTGRADGKTLHTEYQKNLEALNELKSTQVTAAAELKSRRARHQLLKERMDEAGVRAGELAEEEKELHRKRKDLQAQLDAQSGRHAELKEQLESCREDYSVQRGHWLAKESSAKSFEEHIQSLSAQIEDIESQIVKQQARKEADQKLIAQWGEETAALEKEIQNLKSENRRSADGLAEKQTILQAAKNDLAKFQQQMNEREEEIKTLTQKINRAEKNCFEWETKLARHKEEEAHLVRDIFEKYHIDLRRSVGAFLDYSEQEYQVLADLSGMYTVQTEKGEQMLTAEPYQFSRQGNEELEEMAQQLRQKRNQLNSIGEINWQAMEDFERQKKRSDFLKLQERELMQSLEDLDLAIEHIDEKSKERFKAAFAEVDECFQKVFPIIFGGGKAQLKIMGNIEDEECGVDIIARPPGKKMQDINLMSGGEKALTALGLIFSIFLVKPSPFCLLDEVDAPLDDVNVGRFNELLREMSGQSQFILITHNKKTMELNDTLYGITMQEPGVSKAVSVQLH